MIDPLKVSERVYFLIERREKPESIIGYLCLDEEQVKTYEFESCSFIIALTDDRTIIEICHSPRSISVREEPLNPLHGRVVQSI